MTFTRRSFATTLLAGAAMIPLATRPAMVRAQNAAYPHHHHRR
jgi:hypothetical protein